MLRKIVGTASIIGLLLLLAVAAEARVGTLADRQDATKLETINKFNIGGANPIMSVYSDEDAQKSNLESASFSRGRQSVGSAVAPDLGPGKGASIAVTWDDHQVFYPVGRHITHYWNGLTGDDMEVNVHFCYELAVDTLDNIYDSLPNRQTGYNVYDAVAGDWPRLQDVGCALQSADSIGSGVGGNMVVRPDGRATLIAASRFFAPKFSDGTYYQENMLYFQGTQYNCSYDPRSLLNVTFIDSLKYKPLWSARTLAGNHSRYPVLATQVDGGGNVVTHVLLAEDEAFTILGNPNYASNVDYRTFAYFRKLGNGSAGTWSSGQIIDTIERNFADLVADPWSGRVCVAYSNPSLYGRLLNNGWDKDCYYRESLDYGVTWQPKVNITNYLNAIAGVPHYSMYYEAKALYTSDGNLHILFQQTPGSANPYFDGYNWSDFNQDIAHWDRNSNAYVRVANGTYMNDDYLTGSINTIHCGFGGDPATYTQFFNISECDGKLYAIWNQIHSWANEGDYTLSPELLEDCSYTGERLNMANWEIMMSVAQLGTPTLWDPSRHISNTRTPNCGLPGDPDATGGVCGNEYKPYVEHYGLNEAGMGLTWPSVAKIDMTPVGEPAYTGNYFLNAEYMDDQFPGPAWDPDSRNPNGVNSLNSMKWLRIACVEPVEASLIEARPNSIVFPTWVAFGETKSFSITLKNSGNVTLNVSKIGVYDHSGGWLDVSEHPTPSSTFKVTAGVTNTATFDIIINAGGISTTRWLDGEVYLLSDASNKDSVSINIHVLAADNVQSVAWDTVSTHANMFDPFLDPVGSCIALAVSNMGEIGYGAFSKGGVNLDYSESGLECGTRERDKEYLMSGTAFAIMATSSAGAGAKMSQNFNDANQADVTSFDPVDDKGSIKGGLSANGLYDSVYTGKFVNSDSTIAMERTVYGPRSATPATDIINYVVVVTKVYSADGATHNHVTIGSACDFDVPADSPPNNNSGVSSGGFVYFQGTDTTGSAACQSNTTRYVTEAFGGAYTVAGSCVNNPTGFYGSSSLYQLLMEDTSHYRNGTDLIPDQPDPSIWWTEAGVPGLNASALQDTDLALITTFAYDRTIAPTDVLYYWTILTSTRTATNPAAGLTALEAQVAHAKSWFASTIGFRGCGCCVGKIGDVNNSGGDGIPTISDVSMLIDALFITGNCSKIVCIAEADANQSGGSAPGCSDLTISDISTLIDYLFITGPSKILPDCK